MNGLIKTFKIINECCQFNVKAPIKLFTPVSSKFNRDWKAPAKWYERAVDERNKWDSYVQKESGPTNQEIPSYARYTVLFCFI